MLACLGCDSNTADAPSVSLQRPTGQTHGLHGWLATPQGVNESLMTSYPMLMQAATKDNAEGQLTFAMLSQRIAEELEQGGAKHASDQFYAQTGKALRQAIQAGLTDVPDSVLGAVHYNEARALAAIGKAEEAALALDDAIGGGFHDFELLAGHPDFAKFRHHEAYTTKIESWRQIAKEIQQEEAHRDLAKAQSFPFTFELVDIDGQTVSLPALKGKVVAVDLWGTWCPPCIREVPYFVKLQDKYADEGFQVIGLTYERGGSEAQHLKAVREFVEQRGVNYPCIMGDRATKAQIPDMRYYPTTIFLDRSGKVRLKAEQFHNFDYLEAVVVQLLKEE